jgi:glycosyltransferase involved in cell wall biosynthesis
MAAGIPVVASRAGAVPEVVGDAARLVDPDDADALAEALQAVLTDGTIRRDLVTRGVARHDGFSWVRTVDELLDLYRSVRA